MGRYIPTHGGDRRRAHVKKLGSYTGDKSRRLEIGVYIRLFYNETQNGNEVDETTMQSMKP